MVMLEKQNEIIQSIKAMPTISTCNLVSQVWVQHISTYHAMRETKFLYRIHIFQELKLPDAGKRLHFYHWLFVHNCYSILNYIFFSGEAWLKLNGYINTHDYRVCSSTNPQRVLESKPSST